MILDSIGEEPIVLVLRPGRKVRSRIFSKVDSGALDFYAASLDSAGDAWSLFDGSTVSEWSFDGCAISGVLKGQCLSRIDFLKDYWFDWQHYHPQSAIYRQ